MPVSHSMSLPRRSPAAASLAVLTAFLLAGCDTHRQAINTAPAVKAEAQAALATPDSLWAEEGTAGDVALATTLGGPIGGLDPGQLERFELGKDEFEEEEAAEEGLGPVFNEASCTTCHNAPVGGTNGRAETRFGRWTRDGFDPLPSFGGSLIQDKAIGRVDTEHGSFTYVPEVVPRAANVSAQRITTPLFGLGLVDAVTDAALIALSRHQARYTPSTRGTPHLVTDVGTGALRVGRFGWKAQVATLHTFSGDAYLNEMGITSPDFPAENAPQGNVEALAYNPAPEMNDDGEGIERFFDFMTFLGPPPRGARTSQVDAGSKVFRNIGCANCHTPSLTTGTHPVAALSNRTFFPYSDFLLHDMGSLGDGIVQGQAGARLMRTAPLWGLNARPTYLHDGRARSVVAAILGHDGQGSESRYRFSRLDSRERSSLLAFLNSL